MTTGWIFDVNATPVRESTHGGEQDKGTAATNPSRVARRLSAGPEVVPNRYASMTVESMAAVLGTEGTTVDPITALEDAVKAGAEARQKDYKQSIVLGNLAVAYNMAKRHDEALNLEVKVMQLRERTLRPMHIDVLRAQVNAAVTLIFLQRYDDALEILLPALRKFRQCHEADTWHPLAMFHTAKAQVSVKKHALAIDILEKALAHSAVERAMSSIGESKSVLTDLLDQARTHVQAVQVDQDTTKPDKTTIEGPDDKGRQDAKGRDSCDPNASSTDVGLAVLSDEFNRIPVCSRVMLRDLFKLEYTGRIGTVVGFNEIRGRHVVRLDGDGVELACLQEKLLQLVPSAEIVGVQKRPELNGKVGSVSSYDWTTGRYTMDVGGARMALKPANVRLPDETRVRIVGLVSRRELNGTWGLILGYNAEVGRYIIQINPIGVLVRLRRDSVLL